LTHCLKKGIPPKIHNFWQARVLSLQSSELSFFLKMFLNSPDPIWHIQDQYFHIAQILPWNFSGLSWQLTVQKKILQHYISELKFFCTPTLKPKSFLSSKFSPCVARAFYHVCSILLWLSFITHQPNITKPQIHFNHIF
jgi:hypothetical protein